MKLKSNKISEYLCSKTSYNDFVKAAQEKDDSFEINAFRDMIIYRIKHLQNFTTVKSNPLIYHNQEVVYETSEYTARASIAIINELKRLFDITDEELEKYKKY